MDKIRVSLLACLAFISFILVSEYAQFRDTKNKEQLLARQEVAQETLAGDTFSPTNQVTAQATAQVPAQTISDNGEDVPTLVQTSPEAVDAPTPASTDLISVKTDSLDIRIDPKGGDIVYAALPKHLARIDTPDLPFILLENSKRRQYIAQSGLIGTNGTDTQNGRPLFSVEQQDFVMADGQEQLVVDLKLVENNVGITKRFTFNKGSYLVDVDYLINNQSSEEFSAAFYAQIKRDSSVDPSAEAGGGGMGMQPYLGFATMTTEERFKKMDFDDVEEKPFKNSIQGGWIAMVQHYYLSAWIGDKETNNTYTTLKSRSGYNIGRITGSVANVAAGTEATIHNQFYAGPKDQYVLEDIAENLDLSVDYGWLWFVAQPLYALLYFINEGQFNAFGYEADVFGGVQNWGFAIILLTILVKAAFFSLNAKAYTSMAKMRAIQPKMLEMRERYGDDKQKQSQEMMKLYQTEGVNPVGGCLPILVQMPVFIALYWVLLESVELRHAPFIGYIQDLAAMDPYFIMPLIMGVSMFIQQKLNPPPPDPMQAKVMQFLPIIFTFFFLFFPAGLVLYWVVNNILSIAQQYIITKHIIGDEEKKK